MSVEKPGPESEAIVFVVGDDISMREALESLVRSAGLAVETFASAQDFPTLTQSRLLGLLLDRQRYKAATLARRQAHWKSIFAAPGNLFVSIWRALIVAERPRDHISRDRSDIGSPRQP